MSTIPDLPEDQKMKLAEARERLKAEVAALKEKENSGQRPPSRTHEERIAEMDASKNIISLADCMAPAIEGFRTMAEKTKLFADNLRNEIKTIEREKCPEHEESLEIDWDETFALSWRNEKTTLRYKVCRKCREEINGLLVNERKSKSGVPDKLRHASFGNFVADTPQKEIALEKLLRLLEIKSTFIILRGTFGTGKSHLASAVLDQRPGLFITMYDLLTELRKTYEDNSGQSDMIEKYRTTPVLVLDEVSSEVKGVDIPALLYRILGYRHDRGLLTILTSNEKLPTIIEILGGRITDRLRESYGIVTMEWDSHRKKAE